MSDASQWLAAPSHLDDYVRYCASVSRDPENCPEASGDRGGDHQGVPAGEGGGAAAGSESASSGPAPAGSRGDAASGAPLRPAGILVISVIVALEAAALLVAAFGYGTQLLTGAPVLSFWGAVFTRR